MMSLRVKIIAVANLKSSNEIAAAEGKHRVVQNLEDIRAICEALLMRKTPVRPTAALIAERGRIIREGFPQTQTIWNNYRNMVRIWVRAFDDVRNMDTPPPVSVDDLDSIDVSNFDVGSRAMVQDIVVAAKTAIQQRNAFAALISKTVPTPADTLPTNADQVMRKLKAWLAQMGNGPFDLDEMGLRVSRKTPVRTLIMEAELYNELATLVDDYSHASKAKAAMSSS